MRATRVLTLVVFGSITGCAAIFGFDDFVAGSTSDGGDASAGEAGPASEDEADVYVSAKGDDGSDGSRAHPVRSLRQALAIVGRGPAGTAEAPRRVAICAGEYREPWSTIEGEIIVRGGYDCTTWSRPATNPNSLGPAYESATRILNDGKRSEVLVLGAGHPRLEGLTVIGKDVSSALVAFPGKEADASQATRGRVMLVDMTVANETIPSQENDALPQTLAVAFANVDAVVDRSSFTVRQGPDAKLPPPARLIGTALGFDQGQSSVRRSLLAVDTIPGLGVGVTTTARTGLTLEDDLLSVSKTLGSSSTAAAVGVISAGELVTRRNTIQLESVSGSDGAAARTVGVLVISGASLDSDGDRLLGPTVVPSGAGGFYAFRGAGIRRVVNASVVLDASLYDLEESAGVFLDGPSKAILNHNSMYLNARPEPDGGTRMRGFYLNDEVSAPDAGSAVEVENNLVVTGDPLMRVLRASCSAPAFARLANNRFGGFNVAAGGPGCSGALDDVAADAGGGNVAFGCPSTCKSTFVATLGVSVTVDGLRPAPGACALGLGVPRAASVTTDGTGRARGETTTAGAFVLDCN